MTSDEKYMKKCFELALKAQGCVTPNPLVGALIVKDGKIIGEGYHHKAGLAHAEIEALDHAKQNMTCVKGATIYCNLEPCCHVNKRTPPCVQRIIQEGVSKVVISNLDPNPLVAGKGLKLLAEAGIEVHAGVLEDDGKVLNEIFFYHILHKMPFVHIKMAQTIDGKLASKTKDSKWITSTQSRAKVHHLREAYDAILVGANTIREDNPHLTVRVQGKQTKGIKRIILSKSGVLSEQYNVFKDNYKDNTYVVLPTGFTGDFPFHTIFCDQLENGEFNLKQLLHKLYDELGICSLFIEGGQKVYTSFIQQHLYNKISIFIAPKILGQGYDTIADLGHELMSDAIEYEKANWQTVGPDIVFTATRRQSCLQAL